MADQFILFDEPYPIKKKVPVFVRMRDIDKKMPPAAVLERGADAVRKYWNNKNLRKRVGQAQEVY
jgi:hypothetical protein